MPISLSKEAQAIIDSAVGSGSYATPEEAVEAGLKLLVIRDRKVAELRASIQAAIARGGSFTDEEVASSIEAELDEWERENASKASAAE